LAENTKSFFAEIRNIYKIVYKENSLSADVIFPEEIHNVLRQNLKNEREFLEKYFKFSHNRNLNFLRYYHQGLVGKNIQLILKKIKWNVISFGPLMKN